MIRFHLVGSEEIAFSIDPRIDERLAVRQVFAEEAIEAIQRANLALPSAPEILARHPAAHGLASHRAGHIGRAQAAGMVALLANASSEVISCLEEGRPFVCQEQCLLPEADTRGEAILIDPGAPTDHDGIDVMRRSIVQATGEPWSRFVSVVKSVSLVVVKGMPDLPFFSGSGNGIWGSMHMSRPANAAILAESMTHEAAHFWLHAVEEVGVLADQAWTDETWVSPWRDDPRPIGGVIHGIHVFSCAATVLASWLRKGAEIPPGVSREFLGRRAATLVAQVEAGISEFRRNGRGSVIGDSICTASAERIDLLQLWVPPSELQTARAVVRERREQKLRKWRMDGRVFSA
jgi:hypothetical protein